MTLLRPFDYSVKSARTSMKSIMFSIHPYLLDRDTYADAKLRKNLQILVIEDSKHLDFIVSACNCLATDIKTMLTTHW